VWLATMLPFFARLPRGDPSSIKRLAGAWGLNELSAMPTRSQPTRSKQEPYVRTLVVCSGGLDSVTLSHKIAMEKTLTHLVSFDYGQRHDKELDYARRCAGRLGVTHDIIDIADIGRRLTGSA